VKCEKALELVEEYIMGELDPETRLMLEKHLQECSSCNKEYVETEEVVRGLQNIKNQITIKDDILIISKMSEKSRRWEKVLPSVAAAVFFAMFLFTSSVIAFPTFASTVVPGAPVVKQLLEAKNSYNTVMQENQEIKKLNEQIEEENKRLKMSIKEIGGNSILEVQTSEGIGEEDNGKIQNLVIAFIKAEYMGDIEKIKAMCTDGFKVQVDEMKEIFLKDKSDIVFTQISNVSMNGDLYLVNVRLSDSNDLASYQMNFELVKINHEFYVSYVGNDA